MTGHIRKHQRTLWVIISVAVIISFVAYFNPSSKLGDGGSGRASYGSFDGRPIKADEARSANRLARLSGYLRLGEGYDTARAKQQGFDLNQETYFNLLLNARAKEMGIEVSPSAAAAWIRQNLRDERGPVSYDTFLNTRLKGTREGFTETDFQDWVRLQVVREHIADVVGVGGNLVTPREAAREFQRENESLVTSVAFFSTSNYLASVNLEPAALSQFYSNRLAVYRIPERYVLSYVRFETTNFVVEATADLSKITDLTNRLEQIYTQRGPSAFTDAQGQPLVKAAALEQLRSDTISQRANELANAKATEFANAVYRVKPITPANLINEALNRSLPVANTEPFSESARPAGLEDLPTLAQAVAKLSDQNPFTLPMRGTRGVVVGALTQRIPSEIPSFAAVQARVTEDYKRFKSQEMARAEGEAFAVAVTNALAQGKSFAAVAAERSATVVELPAFTISAQTIAGLDPRVNPNAVKNAAYSLKAGAASGFQPTGDGGMVVFLKERKAVDEVALKAGLNAFLEEQRQQRRSFAFQEWASREFQKSGLSALMKPDSAEQ